MIPLRALVDLALRRINAGFINLKRLANARVYLKLIDAGATARY